MQEFTPTTGHKYPVNYIDGAIANGERIGISLNTDPPEYLHAEVVRTDHGLAGVTLARIALHLEEERLVRAKLNVGNTRPHEGSLTIEG